MQTNIGGSRTFLNAVWSALHKLIVPTPELPLNEGPRSPQLRSWSRRVPWAMFGLAPLFLLAASYFVACLILSSGWRIFLPDMAMPFVPIGGFAIFYFGIGRLIYFAAPILIAWGIGHVASHQRTKAGWPIAGLVLIALLSHASQVQASRPAAAYGNITMTFAFGHSFQDISSSVFHILVIFAVAILPYLLLRLQKVRAPSTVIL